MGLQTNPSNTVGGEQRDQSDFTRLRHAREQHRGFPVGQYLQAPPMLFTRDGHNVFLGDLYRGHTAFLVCGGPSLTSHDLSLLQKRGVLIMAVNNAATIVRPQLWCSVDDPSHFSDAIWYDAGILKFVPLCNMEKRFAVRNAAGDLEESRELVGDMPAVFGYRRNENFVAEQFLREDTFNWGNHGDVKDQYGHKGSRSIMYIALRLLHYLGVRKVFLLGCDFRMELGKQNYAFEQDRTRSSVNGNNRTYEILNVRLTALLPHFAEAGFEIVNCTPDSGLKVFPYLDFAAAVEEARSLVPQKIVTAGMYDRKKAKPEPPMRTHGKVPQPKPSPRPVESISKVDYEHLASSRNVTVLVPLQSGNLQEFIAARQTWQKHKPWMQNWPTTAVGPSSHATNDQQPDDVRFLEVGQFRENVNESWGRTLLRAAAKAETPLVWMLDPRAIATSKLDWLTPRYIDEHGEAALIGPKWSYAKPATVFDDLDLWADQVHGLSNLSRLKIEANTALPRVDIETIAGWSLLLNREWIQQINDLVQGDVPCEDLATFLFYCARRQGRGVERIDMKKHGWNHSYSWSAREALRLCAQSLSRS